MKKAIVCVLRTEDPVEGVIKALKKINAEELLSQKDRVLIKPNYITADHPSTGVTTDGRIVEGLVRFLRALGIESIIIAEGSGMADTMEAFKVAGLLELAGRYGLRLVDLNKDELVMVEIPRAMALKRVKIAKTALESTFIVSVPKLKVHRMAGVTLSMKNMMGVVMPKGSVHSPLDEKIVDLNLVIKPNLAVVDGIVAGARAELNSLPVHLGIVIAGKDPVAVDAVGAALMGFDPLTIGHIRRAHERHLGVGDLAQIEVVGEALDVVRRDFRSMASHRRLWIW
ncbi:DUF362 domain-containing protein [Candidatus Bathyarchaeota archaeon]|nr:DUF362 domain-containing protein [Candidatus Bathyarchaeota archaeon]